MNAIQIADSFDSFAIDNTPDGWPAVQQKQLTEAALMLRKQHEAIRVFRLALNSMTRVIDVTYAVEQSFERALADSEGLT